VKTPFLSSQRSKLDGGRPAPSRDRRSQPAAGETIDPKYLPAVQTFYALVQLK
jgi:hypothetical protein